MKASDKESSKSTSYWGMFFSITLHASVLILILFWGFSGTSDYKSSTGPIQVSLSSLDTGTESGPKPASKTEKQPKRIEPKKPEPDKIEKKEEVKLEKEEEVKAPPEPPEKEEPVREPEKEEIKKVEERKEEPPKKLEEPEKEEKPKEEVVEKEPEKKEVIPLKTEKKEEKKPEKKEERKVAEKPEPKDTPKPKPAEKTAKKKKNLDKERSRVLKDIQRQKVLDQLGGKNKEPEEPIGEERRLAMADDESKGLESRTETRSSTGSSSGGSLISPVIINLYGQQVHRKISRNWRIPPSVPTDGSLETLILFKVGRDGRIYDVRVSESSGNPVFDEYCVNAVYNSTPLPPPPSELAEEAETKGVILTFRNEP